MQSLPHKQKDSISILPSIVGREVHPMVVLQPDKMVTFAKKRQNQVDLL